MSFVRIGNVFGSLRALLFLALLGVQAVSPRAGEVTLAWDLNTDTATTGYNVYVISSGATNKLDVGNTNLAVISNLSDGISYSFYATAYNADGLESEPSEQLDYMPGQLAVAPSIVSNPTSQQVNPGSSITFSVQATGTEPLAYQWFKDGVALSGAVDAQLSLSAVGSLDAGSYSVKVSNAQGYVTSGNASLAITAAPVILTQPFSVAVASGSSVSFSVAASGSGPISYQWFKDGTAISGATGSTLAYTAVSSATVGSYTVKISNAAGYVVSAPATLSLLTVPVITMQPISQTVAVGGSAQFVVQVSGSAPFTYQWYKDGSPIAGATSFLLSIPNAQSANSGSYFVIIRNEAGQVQSAVASLSISAAAKGPTITAAPLNRTVFEGSGVSFNVQASGTGTLSYQWFKDGQLVLSGASPIYSITRTKASDAGSYTVTVTDSNGSTIAGPALLTILYSPVITSQPISLTVNTGTSATFTVSANGSGTLSYQWAKDGMDIPGATTSTLNMVSVTSADAGNYTVRVSNNAGMVTSKPASLTLNSAPKITAQPVTQTADAGASVAFSVLATGSGTLSYQWTKNGVDISGATSATYSIASVSSFDEGNYTVRVSNSAGSVVSQSASLTVNSAPGITQQPVSRTVNVGNSVAFSVLATGSGTLSYQWTKNGVDISGATSATYSIASVSSSDEGNYTVRVSNSAGSVVSQSASLTVNCAPEITQQPVSRTVNVGNAVAFSVSATGSGTLSYQWARNGVNISGATSATYSIASASSSDAGNYTVRVSNSAGSVISEPASLTVNSAPEITQQPISRTVNVGNSVAFSVLATGSGTLSYQWAKNGVNISSATSATFSIASVSSPDAGNYTVRVSNEVGSLVSQIASLIVNSAPEIIAQPSNRVVNEGSAVSISLLAKGTGTLEYQWYKNDVALPGATSAVLAFNQITPENGGVYTARVANEIGSVTSKAMTLTVLAAPRILNEPSAQSIVLGGSLFLNVQATGAAPLAYQWYKNGVAVNGATAAYYLVSSAQLDDAGLYSVRISNSVSNTVSTPASVVVVAPPVIATQPLSKTVKLGEPASFSVGLATGSTVSYQWFKNGQPIPEAISETLTIDRAQSSDAGQYSVRISNAAGSVLSASANLALSDVQKAVFTNQPVSQTVSAGQEVHLKVSATGDSVEYQWYKNGEILPGATASELIISSAQKTDTGVYYVQISNAGGTTKSDNATLIVVRPPNIVTQPGDVITVEGAQFNLFAAVTGTAPFQYQWYLNGSALPSATNNTYTVPSALLSNAGVYTVVVSNSAGTIESQAALVSIDTRNALDRGGSAYTKGGGTGGNIIGTEITPALIDLPLIGTTMLIQGAGTAGAWYDLEYTTNLASGSWKPITTVVADENGAFEMISALGGGNVLYRAVARFE